MNFYTQTCDRDKPVAESSVRPSRNRLAYRLSRKLGISLAHAITALLANDACKEMLDE